MNAHALFRRVVYGDPPVEGALDKYARWGFFGAWLVGLASMVGASIDERAIIGISRHGAWSSRLLGL